MKKPIHNRDKTAEEKLAATTAALSLCPFFQACSEKQLQNVAEILIPKSYAKGETVVRQGETCCGFFIIRSGMVHVHRLAADGAEHLIRIFRAPESFAEASLFPDGIYQANGRALSDVELWLVPVKPFTHLLRTDHLLALALISSLSRRLHTIVAEYEKYRFGSAKERLCLWLLQRDPARPGSHGFSVHLAGSKVALSEELGIRQETLSRLLRRLKAEGVLQVHGKEFFIPERAKLASLFNPKIGANSK